MGENILQKYYSERGLQYGMNSLRRRKLTDLICEEGLENKRILDIGCATGFFGKELKRESNTVIGVDISEKLINEAKKVLDDAYALDIENEEWPKKFIENPFDIIICAEVIEHLFDQETFLKKLKTIMKREAKLIITTPNFLVWNNRVKMLLGRFGIKEVFNDPSHIHLLSYKGLKTKLEGAGFQIVKENHVWHPCWIEWLKALLPKNLFVYQAIIMLQMKV